MTEVAFQRPDWAPESPCGGMGARPASEDAPTHTPIRLPSNPPGFAVLEIMGHRKRAGWVEEVEVFGVKFARVWLATPEPWTEWRQFEDYGGPSIFGTMWCSEETARAAAAELNHWEQPLALRQLPARRDDPEDDEPSRGDEPPDPEEPLW